MSAGDIEQISEQLVASAINAPTPLGKETKLSFAGQALKLNTETDAQIIVDGIKSCAKLKQLDLQGNTLGIEAASAIGCALAAQPELERVLWSDLFTGRMKTEIPVALKLLCDGLTISGARLVELDLSDNALGPTGMIGLVEFLKSSGCYTLQELRLNNNGLGVQGGQMLADSLLTCHSSSVKNGTPLALRIFVSGRGRLEDAGAIALAKAFKAIQSLVEVHMPQNGINHRGIAALAEAFAVNKHLQQINLSDNTFTEKGSMAMAAAIPHLEHLEVINFEDCLMRTKGAIALASAITSSRATLKGRKAWKECVSADMRLLGLRDADPVWSLLKAADLIRIVLPGKKAFLKNVFPYMEASRKVKYGNRLYLAGNEINREGAEAIAHSALNMPSLQLLDLNVNQLGVDGIEAVQDLIRASGKADILASLSEDEGTEDEDDNAGNHESSDEEEEDDEEEPSIESDVVNKWTNGHKIVVQQQRLPPSPRDVVVGENLENVMSNLKL